MRTLIGVLVGMALGAVGVAAAGALAGIEDYWLMAPVGLIVGLVVRSFAGNTKASYLAGALAAIGAVGAFLGGLQGSAEWIKRQGPDQVARVVAADTEAGDDEEASTGDGVSAEAPTQLELPTVEGGPAGAYNPGRPNDVPVTDILWLAAGCLIAYELGKGGSASTPSDEGEESQDAPAQESAEDGSGDAPSEGGN